MELHQYKPAEDLILHFQLPSHKEIRRAILADVAGSSISVSVPSRPKFQQKVEEWRNVTLFLGTSFQLGELGTSMPNDPI